MPGLVVVGLDAQISIYPAASNIHGQLYEPLHHGCMEFVACGAPHVGRYQLALPTASKCPWVL